MAFRAGVRRALGSPTGGALASRFGAAAQTALVADALGAERDVVALAELADALAHAGVPRGRQFVLLSGPPAGDARMAARARELKDILGMPVLVHDAGGACFEAGRLADGLALELDDELREAEAIVLCGRYSMQAGETPRGGSAALLPGLASRATRQAFERAVATAGPAPAPRKRAALAMSRAVLGLVPVSFALVWSADDPPVVRAGEPLEMLAACDADGWTLREEATP